LFLGALVLAVLQGIAAMLAWNLLLVPNVPTVPLPLLNPAPFIAASAIVSVFRGTSGAKADDKRMAEAVLTAIAGNLGMIVFIFVLSLFF